MNIRIREPKTAEEFDKYYELRWRVLREPWGQPPGSEKDDLEGEAAHIVASIGGKIIGVGRIHFNSDIEAQIRYMAVESRYRNMGVGSKILKKLEDIARGRGARMIVLNAREEAVKFYRKHGYEVVGDAGTLFDSIRHWRMSKTL
ncbi:MAG: GNAT family N-acetyltransferase [Candidatus Bathyarchaeia archaeon]|nr:GNAT family N-acetyltransferase [Candidatus Bathyarchaeota archaeon]